MTNGEEGEKATELARNGLIDALTGKFAESLPPATDPLIDERLVEKLAGEFSRRLREDFDELFDSRTVTTELEGESLTMVKWSPRGSGVVESLWRLLAADQARDELEAALVEKALTEGFLFQLLSEAFDEVVARETLLKAVDVFGEFKLMGAGVGAAKATLTVLARENLLESMEPRLRELLERAAELSGDSTNLN